MRDELVTFETAKLAKEKGFNEPTYDYYFKEGDLCETSTKTFIEGTNTMEVSLAPTQSLLQRWLREVHNINIIIALSYTTKRYGYKLIPTDYKLGTDIIPFSDTYEQALEQGLIEALKLIKV